jgi:regulatory protein
MIKQMAAKLLIFELQPILSSPEMKLIPGERANPLYRKYFPNFNAIFLQFISMNGGYKKRLTKEQAFQKLKHYCGYQERCHSEVKEKLFSLGVGKSEREEIVAMLIEENYLNEERFAIAFAGGKFRIKQWGKIKIRSELKKRRVSDFCINNALKQIGDKEYLLTIKRLADKYSSSLEGEPEIVRKKKTIDYLMQKGFEGELVYGIILK